MRTSAALLIVSIPVVAAAAVVPLDVCEFAVDVSATVPLRWSANDTRTFRQEAEAVYQKHGVGVCWVEGGSACPGAPVTLYVRVAADVPSAETRDSNALGWIGFTDAGPGRFIVLSVRRAMALLAGAQLGARRLSEMPGMVERLLPRALGRALAHELGHFLLARREHSASGVMRESFRPEDVADESAGARGRLATGDAQHFVTRCGPASRPHLASRFAAR
jgi:hypothetical protein